MRKIARLAGGITEELDGAEEYAERYIDERVRGNADLANRYRTMSLDEMKHAEYLRDEAAKLIADYNEVGTIPSETEEMWDHCNRKYACKVATVKQMLSM